LKDEFISHQTLKYNKKSSMMPMMHWLLDIQVGIFKTNELVGQQYWWPTLLTDVKKYVKGCDTCQQNKASQQPKANPLHPHSVPGGPWEDILVDLISPLSEAKGHNAILAIIDRFSKMIHLIPTTTEITAL
jgi:hypothetical protein